MTTFTAVTYNVLAQSYAHADRYPHSSAEALDPTRRHALLLAGIEALNADLLCLQELEPMMPSLTEPSDHLPLSVDFAPTPRDRSGSHLPSAAYPVETATIEGSRR